MKRSTVDLVVTGDERAAVAAAVDAVRRDQRVLVVLRSDGTHEVARLRRLCRAAKSLLTVMTNAAVVCVDGVNGVEAVVVRYARTGRLCAVNTPAFLSCDGLTQPPPAKIVDMGLEIGKIEVERGPLGDAVGTRRAEVEVREQDGSGLFPQLVVAGPEARERE